MRDGRCRGDYGMKRLRRWLFNGLAGMSLLLGVATAGLWLWRHQRANEPANIRIIDGIAITPNQTYSIRPLTRAEAHNGTIEGIPLPREATDIQFAEYQ